MQAAQQRPAPLLHDAQLQAGRAAGRAGHMSEDTQAGQPRRAIGQCSPAGAGHAVNAAPRAAGTQLSPGTEQGGMGALALLAEAWSQAGAAPWPAHGGASAASSSACTAASAAYSQSRVGCRAALRARSCSAGQGNRQERLGKRGGEGAVPARWGKQARQARARPREARQAGSRQGRGAVASRPHLGPLVPPAGELQQRGGAGCHSRISCCCRRPQNKGRLHGLPQRCHLAANLLDLLPQLLGAAAAAASNAAVLLAACLHTCCQQEGLHLGRCQVAQGQERSGCLRQLHSRSQLLLQVRSCCGQGMRQHLPDQLLCLLRCQLSRPTS